MSELDLNHFISVWKRGGLGESDLMRMTRLLIEERENKIKEINDEIETLENDLEIWNKSAKEEASQGYYESAAAMAKEAEATNKALEILKGLL